MGDVSPLPNLQTGFLTLQSAFQSQCIRRRTALLAYLVLAIGSGIGLFGKLPLLGQVTHFPPLLLSLLIVASVSAPAWAFIALQARRMIAPFALAGFLVAILFLYPRVERLHQIGRGSDQPDCVIVAGHQLLNGRWPYQRDLLWSHNPMSCGPGWVALQAPVEEVAGYRGDMLAIWICSLAGLIACLRWERVSGVVTLILLSSGVWLALANGSDFLTFGIMIAALGVAMDDAPGEPVWLTVITAFAVQFRFPCIFLPLFMPAKKTRRAGIIAMSVAVLTFGAFLAWHPIPMMVDGPLFLLRKMTWPSPNSGISQTKWAVGGVLFFAGLMICMRWRRHFAGAWAMLTYMLIIFGVPAVLNLVVRMRTTGPITARLTNWEGGIWLLACLPLASVLLVREYSPIGLSKGEAPTGPDSAYEPQLTPPAR